MERNCHYKCQRAAKLMTPVQMCRYPHKSAWTILGMNDHILGKHGSKGFTGDGPKFEEEVAGKEIQAAICKCKCLLSAQSDPASSDSALCSISKSEDCVQHARAARLPSDKAIAGLTYAENLKFALTRSTHFKHLVSVLSQGTLLPRACKRPDGRQLGGDLLDNTVRQLT